MFVSPDLAFLFLILGILGILFEVTTPGTSFPGIVGTLFLIFSMYAFSFYEINYFGAGLITFALILLIFEIKVVSYGILTFFGTLSFAFGAYYLIEKNSGVSVSMSIIIISSLALAALSIFLLYLGLNAQKNRKSLGSESLIGTEAVVSSAIYTDKNGEILVLGERWRAKSDENIEIGEKVIIEKVSGLTMFVRKFN